MFHQQIYDQSERVIQILENMLQASILDFRGSWEDNMPLVEFSYNNNFQTSIGMAPYEALYGRKCRSPNFWDDVGERKLLGLDLVQVIAKKIWLIRESLKTTQSRQKKKCRQTGGKNWNFEWATIFY